MHCHRNSVTDGTGALLRINKYDEYGNPEAGNLGTFGYTGQAWLPGINAWYYKARIYDPELGRFPQPDPIGYVGGMNMYAYVGNDPVNWSDPLGLDQTAVVTGPHKCEGARLGGPGLGFVCVGGVGGIGGGPGQLPALPPVVSRRPAENTPRWPRRLNDYERRILKCNGADDETLNEVTVAGFLPPHAYLSPSTDGQTLPDGSGTTIFLRNGNASGAASLSQMWLIAHEFSHAMDYNRGVSVADILVEYAQHGYRQSPVEVRARAYGDQVRSSIESGRCR